MGPDLMQLLYVSKRLTVKQTRHDLVIRVLMIKSNSVTLEYGSTMVAILYRRGWDPIDGIKSDVDWRTGEITFTIPARHARMRDLIGRQVIFVGTVAGADDDPSTIKARVRTTTGKRQIDSFVATATSSRGYAAVRDDRLDLTEPSRRGSRSAAGHWLTHTVRSSGSKQQIEATIAAGDLRPTKGVESSVYYSIGGGSSFDCSSMTVTLPTRVLTLVDDDLDATCEGHQLIVHLRRADLGPMSSIKPVIRIRTEPSILGRTNPQGTAIFLDPLSGRTTLTAFVLGSSPARTSAPSSPTPLPSTEAKASTPGASASRIPWWLWAVAAWLGVGVGVLGVLAVTLRRRTTR